MCLLGLRSCIRMLHVHPEPWEAELCTQIPIAAVYDMVVRQEAERKQRMEDIWQEVGNVLSSAFETIPNHHDGHAAAAADDKYVSAGGGEDAAQDGFPEKVGGRQVHQKLLRAPHSVPTSVLLMTNASKQEAERRQRRAEVEREQDEREVQKKALIV